MASPEAAAELTRKYSQNRNDIEFLHELLEATNKTVKETKVTVDSHTARFDGLDTKIDNLTTRFDRSDTRFDGLETTVDGHTVRFDGLDTKVDSLTTRFDGSDAKVDNLTTRFDGSDTKVDNLTTRFDGLETTVDGHTIRFDGLDTRFDGLETKFESRFDRLEALIVGRSASQPTTEVMRTPQERKVSVLESRMDVYSSQTAEARFELERHNRMFDAYDDRFNTLDSQMTEVLGILRGTGS